MKTAEDFRKEIGGADESFRRCVRQALMDYDRKEDKPVKKKCSLGLALAMIIIFATVTAVAATHWSILDFARNHGEAPDPGRLVDSMEQGTYKLVKAAWTYYPTNAVELVADGSDLVQVSLEELLYEDGWLYASMLVQPRQEKTLVIGDVLQRTNEDTGETYLDYQGTIRDLNAPGSMRHMADDTAPECSVKAYAEAKGFEHVVRTAVGTLVKHADFQLLEDGSLRMLVQMEYRYASGENSPDQLMEAFIPLYAVQYGDDGLIPEDSNAYEDLMIEVVAALRQDGSTRRSIPGDAHDIAGYRGFIEQVFVTPLEDGMVSVIIQMDREKRAYGVTQMSGPVAVILGEDGTVLHEYELYREAESINYLADDRVQHNIVLPAAGLEEDRITIRLVSGRNHDTVYDEYTYTLE